MSWFKQAEALHKSVEDQLNLMRQMLSVMVSTVADLAKSIVGKLPDKDGETLQRSLAMLAQVTNENLQRTEAQQQLSVVETSSGGPRAASAINEAKRVPLFSTEGGKLREAIAETDTNLVCTQGDGQSQELTDVLAEQRRGNRGSRHKRHRKKNKPSELQIRSISPTQAAPSYSAAIRGRLGSDKKLAEIPKDAQGLLVGYISRSLDPRG
jgi:hypothetical protein